MRRVWSYRLVGCLVAASGLAGVGCGGRAGGEVDAATVAEPLRIDASVTEVASGAAPKVIFTTKTGDVPVEVEVAATDAARRKGLMFRESLAPGKGMVFLMGVDKVQTFWMHNTLIPLDMIFVDRQLRVVGVVAEAEPQTDTPRTVGEPSRYVIEVPGGWAAQVGIDKGDGVRFERVLELPDGTRFPE